MTSPIFVLFLSLFSQTARQAFSHIGLHKQEGVDTVDMSLNFRLQTEGNVYRNSGGRQTAPASRQAGGTKRQTGRLPQIGRQTDWHKNSRQTCWTNRRRGRLVEKADRKVGINRQIDRLVQKAD